MRGAVPRAAWFVFALVAGAVATTVVLFGLADAQGARLPWTGIDIGRRIVEIAGRMGVAAPGETRVALIGDSTAIAYSGNRAWRAG